MFVQPLFFALKGIPGAVTTDGNISISNQATEVKNNLAYRICRIVHGSLGPSTINFCPNYRPTCRYLLNPLPPPY